MTTPRLDVEGFILVGGASSRMRTDKSKLVLGGETTVSLIRRAMEPLTRRIRLVGADQGNAGPEYISDRYEQWGPLAGIHSALHAGDTELCLVVACDLPFVTTGLFLKLISLHHEGALFDAVVPLQADGRPQPLCAVYRRHTCLRASEAAIARSEHTPRALLANINTRYVQYNDFSGLAGAENFFFNLNHPEDYERARQIVETSSAED